MLPDDRPSGLLRRVVRYFGLADGPEPSRYGEVKPSLDEDIDALRARVAELERRLDERPG